MYCSKCNVETGKDEFCENCGSPTIESSEVSATITKTERLESIREQFESKKIEVPKFNLKKIISIGIFAVICIAVIVGYNVLNQQHTPKSAVEKYYTYILSKDYDNAYKMLIGTDNDFLSEDNFKKYMESLNLNSYSIKNYNSKDFNKNNELSTSNTNSTGSMFSVQTGGKLVPIEVQKDGKKFLFFDDYKINVDGFTTKWEFEAPKGSKITVNDKDVNYESDTMGNSMLTSLGSNYSATISEYVINSIFNGSYDVTATLDGAKDYKLSGAIPGKKVTIKFEPSDELLTQLKDQAKSFLDLKYSNATDDKYTSLLTQDSKVLDKANQFGSSSTSKTTNKLQDIKLTKQNIDDSEHAKISIKGTVSYEEDKTSMAVQMGIVKASGTKDMTADFYFEKQNDKWLISDTSYMN